MWALRLRLSPWNIPDHPIGLVLGHKLLGAQIDLPDQCLPRARALTPLSYEGPIAFPSWSHSHPKLPENPVGRQPVGGRRVPHRRPIAAPGPLPGLCDPVRSHRIQHHIPTEFEEVRLLLHQNGREPSLEEMPYPFMSSVVRLRVAAIELTHAEGEVRLRRFNEKMIVIIHQAIGVAEPAKAVDDMGEEEDKLRPIAVVHHDILAGIPPTGDMIDSSGELNTKWAGHGA